MNIRYHYSKILAGIFMGMMVFACAPVTAFAQEEIEPETVSELTDPAVSIDENSETITESEENLNDNVVDVQEETEPDMNAQVVSATAESPDLHTVTVNLDDPAGLTLTLKGVSDENQDKIVSQIEQYVDLMIEYNGAMKIEQSDLPDAEKYNLSGYDRNICWAATAANMLWTSGYPQQVVNPETGSNFKSVDEVFDYFRKLFYDTSANPTIALDAFFNGSESESASIWLRPSVEAAALACDEEERNSFKFVGYLEDGEYIREFENLKDMSFGVVIHNIDTQTNEYMGLSHDVAVAGIVYDEKAESIEDRYKALVIVDSDNDPVLSGSASASEIPDAQKAEMAANAINSYTLYSLRLKDYGGHIGYRWSIPYFTNPLSHIDVIIDAYASLKDKVVPQEEEITPQEEQSIPEIQWTSCPMRNDVRQCAYVDAYIYRKAYRDYDFSGILQQMEKEKSIVCSLKDWKYLTKEDTTFLIFVKTSSSLLRSAYLDDQLLSLCYMDFIERDEDKGIFLIVIREEVMQKLSSGDHVLKLQLEGYDEITQIIHIQ